MQWFKSYLSDRKQTVDNGQGNSDFIGVRSGVPQGSILGPTLCLLFINDLPLITKFRFSDLFADDAAVHTHIDSLCSALSSKLSLLRQLATYVSTYVLRKFYQGYILPLIDYGSVT